MDIGKMNHRITLQYPDRSPDGMGGYQRGWKDKCTVWAQFLAPRLSSAIVQGDAHSTVVSQGIVVRTPNDVQQGWRVKYGSRIFKVLHVDDHKTGMLVLTCEEVVK